MAKIDLILSLSRTIDASSDADYEQKKQAYISQFEEAGWIVDLDYEGAELDADEEDDDDAFGEDDDDDDED